jgi:hypothetical protein
MNTNETGTTNELSFKIGQLACALTGIPEDTNEFSFIGRIVVIEGENVQLRAHDGETVEVPLSSLKQAVHYDQSTGAVIVEGSRAVVVAIDHPSPEIPPNSLVTTSTVLRHNTATDFFETRNTLYMADVVTHWLFGESKSPFLYEGK